MTHMTYKLQLYPTISSCGIRSVLISFTLYPWRCHDNVSNKERNYRMSYKFYRICAVPKIWNPGQMSPKVHKGMLFAATKKTFVFQFVFEKDVKLEKQLSNVVKMKGTPLHCVSKNISGPWTSFPWDRLIMSTQRETATDISQRRTPKYLLSGDNFCDVKRRNMSLLHICSPSISKVFSAVGLNWLDK